MGKYVGIIAAMPEEMEAIMNAGSLEEAYRQGLI